MAKSGFVPAWMKIPSSDKTNVNQKLNIDRSNHSQIISGRQRHHSSDLVEHSTTRHSLLYYSKSNGQSQNKSNEQKNLFSFPFPHLSNTEKISSNRKERLLSTPANLNLSSYQPRYNQLSKQTLRLLSVPETSEEKELLIRMGWNDDITYEITDKDKEDYEKQLKLLPKTDNQSAKLITALYRRSLPYINIRDILQLEMINSISDDDSSDD